MVQIDDSGSGSLIGGTCIGLYHTVTKKYYYGIIPVEYYNNKNFPRKKYLDCAIDIVEEGFEALSVTKSDQIEVCQGYMFDKLRGWLTHNRYNWDSTHIVGDLQDSVEKTFERYAVSLGFPEQYVQYTKYPFHFHRILRWVYADYDNRINHCKVGWKSWQKYGRLPTEISIEKMPSKHYSCLKCGKTLEPHTDVKVLRFISNKPNTIYLHHQC